LSVRTVIVRGKEKRMGRFSGKRSNWKKAVVTIAAGQNIEFFEGV
jgi:large subunit ribosomal protein L23